MQLFQSTLDCGKWLAHIPSTWPLQKKAPGTDISTSITEKRWLQCHFQSLLWLCLLLVCLTIIHLANFCIFGIFSFKMKLIHHCSVINENEFENCDNVVHYHKFVILSFTNMGIQLMQKIKMHYNRVSTADNLYHSYITSIKGVFSMLSMFSACQ
jgi:hypothetical protein